MVTQRPLRRDIEARARARALELARIGWPADVLFEAARQQLSDIAGELAARETDADWDLRVSAWLAQAGESVEDALRAGAGADCERLERAFARLNAAGIVARQGYGASTRDGLRLLREEVPALLAAGIDVRGMLFFDAQRLEAALQDDLLFLSFAARTGSAEDALVVAREACDALRSEGLSVQWSGLRSDELRVEPLRWWKRPDTAECVYGEPRFAAVALHKARCSLGGLAGAHEPAPSVAWRSAKGTSRTHNEDAVLLCPERGVYGVVDGLGGGALGARAASFVVESLRRRVIGAPPRGLIRALRVGVDALSRELATEFSGAGATFALLVIEPRRATVLRVGECFVWLARAGRIEERWLDAPRPELDAPEPGCWERVRLPPPCLGSEGFELGLDEVPCAPGDRFALCTDGFGLALEPDEVESLLRSDRRGRSAPEASLEGASTRSASAETSSAEEVRSRALDAMAEELFALGRARNEDDDATLLLVERAL